MKKGILLLLTLCIMIPGYSQFQKTDERPKVGLVLSGGGAKGLAHIGALKVIEEAGIKVDYIGGTSMGAIIGALYASGYSAVELDSMFMETNFSELIQDDFPRGAKSFYEKDDTERYALTIPFNDFKIAFPAALSGGQKIYNELVKLLYHVKDTKDFNELPIPFLCIATNIETGEEILLDQGFLPEAIMASGTFPSLFEPTEVDGRILIDGGVLNNYPVEEVRAMGADVMIGVDVQHGLRERESLGSASEILLQINNFRTVKDMSVKSAMTDIYIKPNMDDFTVIDFDLKETIINNGVEAAQLEIKALKQLAGSQGRIPKPNTSIPVSDSLVINRLVVEGDQVSSRGFIKGKLRFDLGEKISFGDFQRGIGNLAATENFKAIRYELTSNGLGEDLVLKLKENPNKTYLRVGAHYDQLYKSAALLNITRKQFLTNDDTASFDFILGDNVRYNIEYYIDKGRYWSIGVNSRLNDFNKDIDLDVIQSNFNVLEDPNINTITLDVDDITNQFYVQTDFREEFALRLGIEHKYLKYGSETINDMGSLLNDPQQSDPAVFENSHYYSTFGQLVLDTFDDKYYPNRGLRFDGDFHLYLFSSDFNNNFKEFSIGKAQMGAAFPILNNLTLVIETEGGFKLGTSEVSSFDFILGGYGAKLINNFIPFYGYDFLSLPGNSFVKGTARFDLEIAPKNHIMLAGNFSNVEDDIFRLGEWFTEPDYTGYAIGYGLETFMGPLEVFYTWTPQGSDGGFFFSIGYWF
ncbi:MAG: patatin-like phospholipase family protein [Flavobacteriaceae bacterium]|nr:patatin-like phospholipase family protein [Flavobacteriaceae bacterium]MDH3795600.1 patatin-like phospholipase family protein [Flavobacteriaceae bacterium]